MAKKPQKSVWNTEVDTELTPPKKPKEESPDQKPKMQTPFEQTMDLISEVIDNKETEWMPVPEVLSTLSDRVRKKKELAGGGQTGTELEVVRGGGPVSTLNIKKNHIEIRSILNELSEIRDYVSDMAIEGNIYKGSAYKRKDCISQALLYVGAHFLEEIGELAIKKGAATNLEWQEGKETWHKTPLRWKYFSKGDKRRDIYCYDPIIFARIQKVCKRLGWEEPYGFQWAMVLGVAHSTLLPKELRADARREAARLKHWVEEEAK